MSAAFYRVPQASGPPSTLEIPLEPLVLGTGGNAVDMTACTGVTYEVLRPNGSRVTDWTGTVTTATFSVATSVYALQGDEFDTIGRWRVLPFATVPGGAIPCEEAIVQVTTGTPPAEP